ncbi:MAG: hypothetical protein ACREQB_11205 [Candidatus Binataceae bacterium]
MARTHSRRRVMLLRFAIIIVALAGGVGVSGCLAPMIGGLAYQGYDYMKEKKDTPATTEEQRKDPKRDQPADSQPEVQ